MALQQSVPPGFSPIIPPKQVNVQARMDFLQQKIDEAEPLWQAAKQQGDEELASRIAEQKSNYEAAMNDYKNGMPPLSTQIYQRGTRIKSSRLDFSRPRHEEGHSVGFSPAQFRPASNSTAAYQPLGPPQMGIPTAGIYSTWGGRLSSYTELFAEVRCFPEASGGDLSKSIKITFMFDTGSNVMSLWEEDIYNMGITDRAALLNYGGFNGDNEWLTASGSEIRPYLYIEMRLVVEYPPGSDRWVTSDWFVEHAVVTPKFRSNILRLSGGNLLNEYHFGMKGNVRQLLVSQTEQGNAEHFHGL